MIFWLIGGAAALYLLSKGGSGILGRILAPKLYQLTDADISTIAHHYHDGTNSYVIQDTNARYSLADAMHRSIQNLRIEAYVGDGFCQGVGVSKSVEADQAASNLAARAAQADPEPISHTILAITSKIFGFISAHHAAAIRKENAILCPLVPSLNSQYAYVEQQMRSGKFNGQQVIEAIDQIQQQAHSVIAEDSSSGALHAVGEEVDAVTEAFTLIVQRSGI